jgi:hypothetical protein
MAERRLDAATIERMQAWFPRLDLGRIRIVDAGPMCWFVEAVLRKNAMALPPYIFYGRARGRRDGGEDAGLLAHELAHCEQARRMGRARFFARYLFDLSRARFRYSRDLPLEREAYALQAQVLRPAPTEVRSSDD